jgi:hypothetical protein
LYEKLNRLPFGVKIHHWSDWTWVIVDAIQIQDGKLVAYTLDGDNDYMPYYGFGSGKYEKYDMNFNKTV